MPPPDSGKSLSKEEKQLIRTWIEQGAEWSAHWAFTAPRRPDIPDIDDGSVRNAIDAFVKQKLLGSQLDLSPEADLRPQVAVEHAE